jgi:hypothetical protein
VWEWIKSLASGPYRPTWWPPPPIDTSVQGDAPWVSRAIGAQTFSWRGRPYLAVNVGNELRIMDIANPAAPQGEGNSGFGVPPFGDRDYNLFNFSVADDCRYGVAGFQSVGCVLFDLGASTSPLFMARRHYASAAVLGGLAFRHQAQDYLVVDGRVLGQAPGACLVLPSGVHPGQQTMLKRLVDATGEGISCDGGYYLPGEPAHLYLVSGTRVYVYRLAGAGACLTAAYVCQPMRAGWVRGPGLSVDWPARLACACNPLATELWSLANPEAPVKLASWKPSSNIAMTTCALRKPFLWVAASGGDGAIFTHTYAVGQPTAPREIGQEFWADGQPWNSYPYGGNIAAAFHPTAAGWLYGARWSTLQTWRIWRGGA